MVELWLLSNKIMLNMWFEFIFLSVSLRMTTQVNYNY